MESYKLQECFFFMSSVKKFFPQRVKFKKKIALNVGMLFYRIYHSYTLCPQLNLRLKVIGVLIQTRPDSNLNMLPCRRR